MVTSPRSPEPLVLTEYGEAEIVLSAEELQPLRRLARNRLTVLPGDAPDRWVVRATSYVGTIVTPAIRILVRPKVATANLFHLLEAGGRAIDLGPAVFEYDRTADLMPSFATFFARHLEMALSRGVPREYREQQDRLVGMRGRVDLPAQQRLLGMPLPVECRFDEYTADVHVNRLLRGALDRLLRLPGVAMTTRQALRHLAARFEDVTAVSGTDLRVPTAFTRLTEHCRPAERLARIILTNASLQDAAGTTGAAEFLVDMNVLFEQFVESRIRRYLGGRLDVEAQGTVFLDRGQAVRMRPDLLLRAGRKRVYAIDSKYKITDDGLGRGSDYYQLLAYTTALDLAEGLLVYCQRDGAAPPREVVVRHIGKRLRTWAVRLDRTPTHVEEELRRLADELAASSPSLSSTA